MPTFTLDVTDTLTLVERVSLALPYAFVTNSVRSSASSLLRLLRRPVRYVTVNVGPQYGFVQPGDTIYCDHELLPELSRAGGTWRYVPLYVVEVNDPISTPKIEIKCLDLREYYCAAWSPLRTDVGMTGDLNGIAMIDRAGGWLTDRAQLAYGERPAGTTDTVDDTQLFQEVAADNPVVSRFGLQVEGGGDTNYLLNSTFSEGAGDTFTSWTKTTSGSAIGVSWTLYTLIDATGFRRSIQLATFNVAEDAYVSQTASGMGGKRLFVRIHYRDGGLIDNTIWRAQRSSDSKWFRNSDSSWQVATTDNTLDHSGASFGKFFASNMLDLSLVGATDVTVHAGIFAATPAVEQISQLNGLELTDSPRADAATYMRYRSPLPTKAATVTRVVNQTYFVNDSAVRVMSPTRGFIKISFRPNWSHDDLLDGDVKYIWARDHLLTALYYQRQSSTIALWRFENGAGQRAEINSDDVSAYAVAARGQEYTIVCRWTSNTENEYDLIGQAMDIWLLIPTLNTWHQGNTQENATVDSITATSKLYLGRSTNTDTTTTPGLYYADGHIFNFTCGDHVPTEEELKRM